MPGVRVVSWNLWWRFGPWQQRQPAICSVLAGVKPDVAALQEVFADGADRDQAEDLAAAFELHCARARHADGRPASFGNALLSRWPLVDVETLRLPLRGHGNSPRAAVIATVDAPAGPFTVASLHLSWQYDATLERQDQLAAVVAEIHRRQEAGAFEHPAILAGDLNAVPDSDEVRRLTGLSTPYVEGLIFTDAWAAVGEGPGHTWVRDNPHAADAQFPRRRVDHVMVGWPRPKPLGNPLRAELAGRMPVDGMVPSDHYAVVVDLDDRRSLE